ncbi:MAG: hypothetical protein JJE03_02590 [Peptostreptococcaceae bacterium]|nr:hypothetical protein [Peptostreptococcaceae bacterium]
MYIVGLKGFEEFGTSNEGTVRINKAENSFTSSITKATGSVTGTLDGPIVYFKMDITTKHIIEKEFEPASYYEKLGVIEFAEHSEEVINLTDERMVEIGEYFIEIIDGLEQ